MRIATELTKKRFADIKLDAIVDGEVQADAALVPRSPRPRIPTARSRATPTC